MNDKQTTRDSTSDKQVSKSHFLWFVLSPQSEFRPQAAISKILRRQADDQIRAERLAGLRSHRPIDIQSVGGSTFTELNSTDLYYPKWAIHNNWHWCLEMLPNLSSGDCVLFMDALDPFVSIVRHWQTCSGLHNLRLTGILHGSSFMPGDLMYRNKDQQAIELAAYSHLDAIVVATPYFKTLLEQNVPYTPTIPFGVAKKIHVTGLPVDQKIFKHKKTTRQNKIVAWPHRWAEDRGLKSLTAIARALQYDGIEIRVLTSNRRQHEHIQYLLEPSTTTEDMPSNMRSVLSETREQYYQELAECTVVLTTTDAMYEQKPGVLVGKETFGYSVLEATALGLIPIVPAIGAYVDLYDPICLYQITENAEQIANRIRQRFNSIESGALDLTQQFYPKSLEDSTLAAKRIVDLAMDTSN